MEEEEAPTKESTVENVGAKDKKKEVLKMASVGETMSFVLDGDKKIQRLFGIGVVFGVLSGCIFPAFAYIFAFSFSEVLRAVISPDEVGFGPIRRLAFIWMAFGVYAFATSAIQNWAFELVAYHSTQKFQRKVRIWLPEFKRGYFFARALITRMSFSGSGP